MAKVEKTDNKEQKQENTSKKILKALIPKKRKQKKIF